MRTPRYRRALLALALAAASVGALPLSQPAAAAPTTIRTAALAFAPPTIPVANVKAHLQQLQTIATANGGTRRSTTAGYTASVNYVVDKLTAAGFTVVKQPCTSGCTSGAGPNIIADWPGGDPNKVYMLGAHLDSVTAGPGINDNGSGSAMVLEIALTLAAQNPTMLNHARFGWWTDEEQGLNGSDFYVRQLPTAEKAKIKGYFNFDMVASVNGGYFINQITSSSGQILKSYYDSIGVQTEENVEGAGRSDDAPFISAGIPTSGVAAGASAVKTAAQVTKWGGTRSAYDPCYHRACDSYPTNIDDTVLTRAIGASSNALWSQAVGTPVGNDFSMAASPTAGAVNPGSSTSTTVNTTVTAGATQTVNLSASGLPGGATASFSPSSVTSGGSSTLTISTTAATAAGTYPVTVTGTGASATRTTTFTLTVNGPAGCSGTNGNNVTISDNTTVESPITISGCTGNASATSTVEVHIVHTYIGDLVVNLVAPDGSLYLLHNRAGGTTDNINQTYTVNVSGEAANGTWKLRVQDAAGGDVGIIDSWTLSLGGGAPVTTVFSDTFEAANGWTVNPNGTDTATLGPWERGDPAATASNGTKQLGATVSGTNDLVTGRLAGTTAGDFDVDGGTTSISSPAVALPATGTLNLSMSWYLAHGTNSSSADSFRISIVHNGGTTVLFTQAGAATNRNGAWTVGTWNVSAYAGQSVRILVQATDASTGSLVEAAVDDVKVTRQ